MADSAHAQLNHAENSDSKNTLALFCLFVELITILTLAEETANDINADLKRQLTLREFIIDAFVHVWKQEVDSLCSIPWSHIGHIKNEETKHK